MCFLAWFLETGISSKFFWFSILTKFSRLPGFFSTSRLCLVREASGRSISFCRAVVTSRTLCASAIVRGPVRAGRRRAIRLASSTSPVPWQLARLNSDSIESEVLGRANRFAPICFEISRCLASQSLHPRCKEDDEGITSIIFSHSAAAELLSPLLFKIRWHSSKAVASRWKCSMYSRHDGRSSRPARSLFSVDPSDRMFGKV